MGQQQFLLIVLSVIVVGLAISIGIVLFTSNAVEQKRNEIISECSLIASEAQTYFRRPESLGGGGKSFVGWSVPSNYSTTEAGFFISAIVSEKEVIITGTGNELVTDRDSVKVQMTVTPNEYQTTIIN